MPRRPDLPCAVCGRMLWRGRTSLPEGQATCRPCRAARPKQARPQAPRKARDRRKARCVDCGGSCVGHRCRKCRDLAQRIRSAGDTSVRRWVREKLAPGLSQYQRKALLRKWMQQCTQCAYCPALATTVDHVLPLVRGGTNHEGNLVPCCRRCNSSKAGLLIVEWRTGKRLPPMMDVPYAPKPKPVKIKAIVGVQMQLFKVCTCGTAFQGRAGYCSQRCYQRAHPRAYEHVEPKPCMDCGQGEFNRRKRCDVCALEHRRLRRRAEKARARQRAQEMKRQAA